MATVLIIDSEAAVAGSLSDALAERGVQTEVTGDGAEGLKVARDISPQAIVLCVELSRVSGYSICNKLKKDADLAQIPLVLTSSQATDETFEQHKKLKTRAEQYLRKPYDMGHILGLIGQYIDIEAGDEDADDGLDVSIEDATELNERSDLELDVEIDAEPEPEPERKAAKPAHEIGAAFDEGFAHEARTAVMARPSFAEDLDEPPASKPTRGTRPAEPLPTGSERSKTELRQLRSKVQKLEQTLQEKDLEFNERLLQESSRGREAVELKKRLGQVERELAKYEQAAERAKASASEAEGEAEATKAELDAVESERDALSEKIAQLVTKVKSLAKERDELRDEAEGLRSGQSSASMEVEQAQKLREKARKAVDIAMQLLDETGLLH